MSLFLLVYDRQGRKLLDIREFPESGVREAHEVRADVLRAALRDNLDHEIVLFQADSLDALRTSHASYFLSAEELQSRTIEGFEREIAEAG